MLYFQPYLIQNAKHNRGIVETLAISYLTSEEYHCRVKSIVELTQIEMEIHAQQRKRKRK